MNWKNYSSLKSDGNASFAKETVDGNEVIMLVQKSWNSSTGVANDDSKREYSLADLEREKANYDSEMARAKEQSDGLALAITDFKKL
jgi:hypothetical protein